MTTLRVLLTGSVLAGLLLCEGQVRAADKDHTISIGEGKLVLTAPEKWVRKEPATRIVEHEFAVEGKKGQDAGRVTVMGAGGSIETEHRTLDRPIRSARRQESKEKAKIEKKKIAGLEVHVVDIAGTYKDMPAGPFAGGKAIDRENYRMLGAIIPGGRVGRQLLHQVLRPGGDRQGERKGISQDD